MSISVYDIDVMAGTPDGAAGAGIAEDLLPMTVMIAPTKTPLWSSMGKTPCGSFKHEWQTDDLDAAAANAHVEGADFASPSLSGRVRIANYTQIMKKRIQVSGTAIAVKLAGGISSEFSHQKMKAVKSLARDIEFNIWTATANAGDATTARTMRGIDAVMRATGNAATAAAGRDLTGDLMNNAIQLAYDDGSDPDIIYTRMKGKRELYRLVSTDYGTRFLPSGGGNKIVQTVDIYESEFGVLRVQVTRWCALTNYYIMQKEMWKASILRRPFTNIIGVTGDNRKAEIITELTLEYRHPDAGALLADINMPGTA